MTPEQQRAARERLAKITAPPWMTGRWKNDDGELLVHDTADTWVASVPDSEGEAATFIAHAPGDLRLALDEIERLNAAAQYVRDTINEEILRGVTEAGTVRASLSVNLSVEQVRAALTGEAPK